MSYTGIIVILLFELGFGVKFNLIGTISISELFLLFYVPLFVLPKVKWSGANDISKITVAYALLLSFQAFSEFMVDNDLTSALKGLAITVVSYFHFVYLISYLSRQKTTEGFDIHTCCITDCKKTDFWCRGRGTMY